MIHVYSFRVDCFVVSNMIQQKPLRVWSYSMARSRRGTVVSGYSLGFGNIVLDASWSEPLCNIGLPRVVFMSSTRPSPHRCHPLGLLRFRQPHDVREYFLPFTGAHLGYCHDRGRRILRSFEACKNHFYDFLRLFITCLYPRVSQKTWFQ